MMQSSKQLTDKQRELVEKNIKLAHFIKNKWLNKNIYGIDYDELESACLFGLTKAGMYFDDKRGIKFASFATTIMENEIKMLFRNNHKHRDCLPMSAVVVNDKEDVERELNFMDKVGAKEDEYKFIDHDYINHLLHELNTRDRDMIVMRFIDEERQRVIGKKYRLSQSLISRRIVYSLNKMKEYDKQLMN